MASEKVLNSNALPENEKQISKSKHTHEGSNANNIPTRIKTDTNSLKQHKTSQKPKHDHSQGVNSTT